MTHSGQICPKSVILSGFAKDLTKRLNQQGRIIDLSCTSSLELSYEIILRIHHEQPTSRSIHRCHQQTRTTRLSAQGTFFGGFTAKYNVSTLVYFERYSNVYRAIGREKELKGWQKKLSLIESTNPEWKDLSYGWYQKISMVQLKPPQ